MAGIFAFLVQAVLISQATFAEVPVGPQSDEFLKRFYRCREGIECERFLRSLYRDNKRGCRPVPNDVEALDRYFSWLEKNIKTVQGRVFYADAVPGDYGYFMYSRGRQLVIHTRVHFKNWRQVSESDRARILNNIELASAFWEETNRARFPIRYIFEVTENPEAAFVRNIHLRRKTNGPYFKKWNIDWSWRTLAHEFGHVLGLDDEYSYLINSALQIHSVEHICERTSIMCQSHHSQTEIKRYHQYLILRRLFCS